jgi:hypothetical protein
MEPRSPDSDFNRTSKEDPDASNEHLTNSPEPEPSRPKPLSYDELLQENIFLQNQLKEQEIVLQKMRRQEEERKKKLSEKHGLHKYFLDLEDMNRERWLELDHLYARHEMNQELIAMICENVAETVCSEADPKYGTKCIMCLRETRNACFIPCGHTVCCMSCSNFHFINASGKAPSINGGKCSVCGEKIESVSQVDIHF